MSRLFTIIAAAVALVFVAAEDIASQNAGLYIYEQQINETLKNLSEKLAQYDPFFIAKINVNFENELGKFNFEVEDTRVSGHSKFWATNLRVSMVPPSVTFDIQFQELHILVPYYDLDALAVFLPLYGNGFMNLRVSVINLGGSARMKLGTGGISGVKNVKARFNLEKSKLIISGLLHNEPMSKIVSTSTTECFPEFVNTYGERLGQLFGKTIERTINNVLNPSSALDYDIPFKGGDTFKIGNGTLQYYYEL